MASGTRSKRVLEDDGGNKRPRRVGEETLVKGFLGKGERLLYQQLRREDDDKGW